MKTRKTTTVTRPRPAALLIALAAITLAGPTLTEARTQSVQDTPISVSAFNREQIENMPVNQRDFRDLSRFTPNVVTDSYTGRSNTNNIRIRGANNTQQYGGYFVDGVYVNPNNSLTSDLYDVESVQVLRGPQGTLYGRNNGGVINLNNTRANSQTQPFGTVDTEQPYKVSSRYQFNDRLDSTIKYTPAGATETPNLTVGQNWNTGRLNPQVNYNPTEWNPTVNTTELPNHDTTSVSTTALNPNSVSTVNAGLNTRVNNTQVNDTPTHTPTETVATNNPNTTTDTHAGNTPTETTPAVNTHQPTTEVAETGDSTGIFNQPQGNGYAANSHPCPKVNRHEINNRVANNARANAANTAQSLIAYSQPYMFYDTNYYNTTADELATRNAIGNQLAQGLTVVHDPITMTEPPKTYYRVAGGGDYTLIANDPPLPEYKTTVRPIKPQDMSDRELALEIKYGPSLTKGYLREAGDLRDDSARYRKWAKERRESAARARASAESSRTKAKNAKTADSREFHEQQAERYDDHADILEDSAGDLDRSAQNNDNAAERYEQDAAQTAANMGQAIIEQAQRQAQATAQAAQAQAAREAAAAAEAARKEAAHQRSLELIRQSQQESQSDTSEQPQQGNTPRQPSRPDARIPRPGKEPARETVRKLLND